MKKNSKLEHPSYSFRHIWEETSFQFVCKAASPDHVLEDQAEELVSVQLER